MHLKTKLQHGESILGTMVNIVDSPDIIRILQQAGFDYVVVDNEHGYMDYSKTAAMLNLSRALGFPAIVRIPEVRREVVLKYMEMGADGILMPNCDTAEQARELVRHAKYAPLGNRGVALFRNHSGYQPLASGKQYMQEANEASLIICQIESAQGVENIDAILEVAGVDAVFVGPNDLSQGLGIFGEMDNPILTGAIDKVIAAAKAHGKYSGIFSAGAPQTLMKWKEKGTMVNLWGSETTILFNAARDAVTVMKQQ